MDLRPDIDPTLFVATGALMTQRPWHALWPVTGQGGLPSVMLAVRVTSLGLGAAERSKILNLNRVSKCAIISMESLHTSIALQTMQNEGNTWRVLFTPHDARQ